MSVIQIPVDTGATFIRQTTTLNGTQYILRLYYAQRDSVYYLSIYDINENPLLTGLKLTAGLPIAVDQVAYNTSLPVGNFIVLPFDGSQVPPQLGELGLHANGQRCALFFLYGTDFIYPNGWYGS